jgi:hypothetical protein
MSKLPGEENQLEAYRAAYEENKLDYDTTMELFKTMKESGYESDAIILEDEWRAEHRAEIEAIETVDDALYGANEELFNSLRNV